MAINKNNSASLEEILTCYSGRRLQYAIKLGILPAPENLSQHLRRKTDRVNSLGHEENKANPRLKINGK